MDTKYYIVIDKLSKGPFSLEQLRDMNLDDNTLIWYDGLDNWKKLSELPILKSRINESQTPPAFDKDIFEQRLSLNRHKAEQQTRLYNTDYNRPNNYLAEAIISLFFFLPTAIVAIYKATQVDKLFEQGRQSEAFDMAISARNWAIASVVIGFIYLIYLFI